MPRIGLSETWSLIPEGVHVFKITKVYYKENFGKLEITMKTDKGQSHVERFSLIGKNHEPNEGALNAFSYFARAAMNDYETMDVDPEDLVGRYIRCTVEHEEVPGKDNPEKMYKFIRLVDKVPADGYDESERTPAQPPQKTTFDLDSLLS